MSLLTLLLDMCLAHSFRGGTTRTCLITQTMALVATISAAIPAEKRMDLGATLSTTQTRSGSFAMLAPLHLSATLTTQAMSCRAALRHLRRCALWPTA